MKIGEQVKMRGLDMKCRPTIEIARIIEILDKPVFHPAEEFGTLTDVTYDCVVDDGKIKMYADSRDFI